MTTMTANPGAIGNLLLCAPKAVDFRSLVACGPQSVATLLKCLPNQYFKLWCGTLLSDTVRLLGHDRGRRCQRQ
jgi:hypothetical protein